MDRECEYLILIFFDGVRVDTSPRPLFVIIVSVTIYILQPYLFLSSM